MFSARIVGEDRGKKFERPAGQGAPCEHCPKESPAEAKRHELSDANQEAYAHFRRHRSAGFATLTDDEKTDAIVRRNFSLIGELVRAAERRDASESLMVAVRLLR